MVSLVTYFRAGVAVLIVALAATVWILLSINGSLRTQIAAANSQLRAHEEAARILTNELRTERKIASDWRTKAEKINTLEGSNEPLNPYESGVFDSVRGEH